MKKKMSKLFSLILVLTLALGMSLNVSASTDTTIGVPTETVEFDASDAVGTVKVTAGGTTVTAGFFADDNVDDMFIRAMLPATTSANALQQAQVEVTLADSASTFSATGISFTGTGAVRTCSTANLLNHAYTLTIDDVDYILAAGITGGSQAIPASEPNMITGVTVGGVNATVTRNIVQSEYMGNAYFSADPDNLLEWTSINYYVEANMGTARPASLSTTYTKANGTSETTSLDMTRSVPSITVDGKTYYFKLAFTGTISVKYCIDFQEFEETRTASNASSFATTAEWEEAIARKNQIMTAWTEYFGNEGQNPALAGQNVTGTISVASGTTVMSIMQEFLNAKFPGIDTSNSSTYISSINNLGEFDIGSMSGWMYLEGEWNATCSVPMVGAADYQMNVNNATITWFYVTDYMNHF